VGNQRSPPRYRLVMSALKAKQTLGSRPHTPQ